MNDFNRHAAHLANAYLRRIYRSKNNRKNLRKIFTEYLE